MTRDEHLKWAKQRALEYIDRGDLKNGITSMLSDLSKHPELEKVGANMAIVGIMFAGKSAADARRFIEGFN